jgi:hypothetical protein
MRKTRSLILISFAVHAASGALAHAQQVAVDTVAQRTLFVFLDCNVQFCDFDHVRREIQWVNWVRDRQDADVHVLVTGEATGGGGWDLTLDYIGREALEGQDKSLHHVSRPTDTDAEVRDGLTRTLAAGLVQFVEPTSLLSRLRITYVEPQGPAELSQEHDPWDLWVFRVSADGWVIGESQQRSYVLKGSAAADRVSEAFKFNFGVLARYGQDEFDFDDGSRLVSTSEDFGADLLLAWSLGSHWALGMQGSLNRSTFSNLDLGAAGGPAIEYNVFPYDESTRRQLIFRYLPEVAGFDYELVTVEGWLRETRLRHRLIIFSRIQQPWGELHLSVSGTQYLHDPATHRIDTWTEFGFRVFRGFYFNVFGGFARIKDQFFLPNEGLTEEEILLRRRQRETDFRFDAGVGLSFQFGSKFANVVNPRMGRR